MAENNTALELQALRRADMMMKAIERPFKRDIIREKNKYIRQSADYAVRHKGLSDDLYIAHKAAIKNILDDYYYRTIRVFSIDTEDTITGEKTFRFIERKNFWEGLFYSFIADYALSRATSISETTREDIRAALDDYMSVESGQGEQDLIRAILLTQGASAYRADTIARTETHAAAMYASLNTSKLIQRETGAQRNKKWIAALDERTRPAHAAANGSIVAMDEKFNVGGEMMDRPSDPNASAHNTINCRCVLVYPKKV